MKEHKSENKLVTNYRRTPFFLIRAYYPRAGVEFLKELLLAHGVAVFWRGIDASHACTLGSQSDVEDLTNRAGRSFDRAKQTRSGGILPRARIFV